MDQERLILFTGHFGSGKTEIAVNYAVKCALSGHKTVLVDLDIVNPFFRSAELRDQLEMRGIKVITPNFAATGVDIPSLPAEIYSVFADKSSKVIFDIGGDEMGAGALGQYFPYFRQEPFRMYYVINTKRPLSATQEDILAMMQEVEGKSRLKITHLINNTNLSYETRAEDLIEGQALIEQISNYINIPIAWITGTGQVLDRLPANYGCRLFPIEIYMKPPWQIT